MIFIKIYNNQNCISFFIYLIKLLQYIQNNWYHNYKRKYLKLQENLIMEELRKIVADYILPTLGIIMLLIYIFAFRNELSVIFWSIFIIDRVIAFLFEGKFQGCIDSIDNLSNQLNRDSTISLNKVTILLIGYAGIGLVILTYILFVYTRLFVIIILGEVIDIILKKILNSIN